MKLSLSANARKTAVGLRRFRNSPASLPVDRPPTKPCPRLKYWHCAFLPTASSTAIAAPTPFRSTLPLREPAPSMKGRGLLAALLDIGWQVKRQTGSHRTLSREGWPDFVFAFS